MLPQWLKDLWGDLPANTPEGVARALLVPSIRQDMNGTTIWVAGNSAVEIEETLHNTQSRWMGAKLSANVDEGQRRMGVE
jgi:hypothetical protein